MGLSCRKKNDSFRHLRALIIISLQKSRSPIEQAARDKIAKHRNLYNLLPGDLGFLPLVVSTSGRLDEEAGHEADAAGGRRDRDFLIQRSRFLAALKTRLGLILAKAVAMRVMINATGCPAPVLDRHRMNTHKHLSQLIESAIDHDIPTPV